MLRIHEFHSNNPLCAPIGTVWWQRVSGHSYTSRMRSEVVSFPLKCQAFLNSILTLIRKKLTISSGFSDIVYRRCNHNHSQQYQKCAVKGKMIMNLKVGKYIEKSRRKSYKTVQSPVFKFQLRSSVTWHVLGTTATTALLKKIRFCIVLNRRSTFSCVHDFGMHIPKFRPSILL